MPRWFSAIGPLTLILAAVIFFGTRLLVPQRASPQIGTAFPALALTALPGTSLLTRVDLARGRPVVVNLFASWCVPCRAEAPQLIALAHAGVTVTGIAVADTGPAAARFVAETRVPFARAGLDARGQVQAALGTTGIPETWVVDGNGFIRLRIRGDLHDADVAAIRAITG